MCSTCKLIYNLATLFQTRDQDRFTPFAFNKPCYSDFVTRGFDEKRHLALPESKQVRHWHRYVGATCRHGCFLTLKTIKIMSCCHERQNSWIYIHITAIHKLLTDNLKRPIGAAVGTVATCSQTSIMIICRMVVNVFIHELVLKVSPRLTSYRCSHGHRLPAIHDIWAEEAQNNTHCNAFNSRHHLAHSTRSQYIFQPTNNRSYYLYVVLLTSGVQIKASWSQYLRSYK